MTKIQLCPVSDLHLEINSDFVLSRTDVEIIVLAGDISPGYRLINSKLFRNIQDSQHIVVIDGNHEFYHRDINDLSWHEGLNGTPAGFEKRLHHLKNEEIIIHGVRVLGATLWTNYLLFGQEEQENCMIDCNRYLNDHRLISNGEWTFSAQDALELHKLAVAWLTEKLDEPFSGPTIVVTHHAPSPKSVARRFAKDPVSAGFASDLEYLMDPAKVQLWIHGHMHDSFDYQVNGVRVICNPRGYCRYESNENGNFDPGLIIEIDTETRHVEVIGSLSQGRS